MYGLPILLRALIDLGERALRRTFKVSVSFCNMRNSVMDSIISDLIGHGLLAEKTGVNEMVKSLL